MSYTSVKQLGGVISISSADNGDVISSSTEMNGTRAIVFDQQLVVGANVTLAKPTNLAPKIVWLRNRGSVNIFVESIDVQPNVTMGIWWDGVDWTPVSVEGIGVVSNIQDTATVNLVGSGAPFDPLEANVKISTALNNGLIANNDGLYIRDVILANHSLVVVDKASGSDGYLGNFNEPYRTIQYALDHAPNRALVLVMPGSYAEDIVVPPGKNLLVEALSGANDSPTTIVNGTLTMNNLSDGFRFRNIGFEAPSGSGKVLTFTNNTGFYFLDNVTLSRDDTTLPSVVSIDIHGNTGTLTLRNGSQNGLISLTGNNPSFHLAIEGGNEAPIINQNSLQSTVTVTNRDLLGYLVHTAGNMLLKGVASIDSDSSNRAIFSTAGSSNVLSVQDASAYSFAKGTYGDIVKTGTAPFSFSAFAHKTNNNTFTGARTLIENAADIAGNYVPNAYSIVDDSLPAHLKGINDALGATAGGLAAVTTVDGDTVEFTGNGTLADPLTAEAIVSPAPGNQLVPLPDGLFVSVSNTGLDEVHHGNTQTVDLTGLGSLNDPLEANVSVSGSAHNLITIEPDGLYALQPTPYFEIVSSNPFNWLDTEVLFSYPAARDYTLDQGLPRTKIDVMYNKDGSNNDIGIVTTIKIIKVVGNTETQIGTITFNGSSTPVIAFGQNVAFAEGNILRFIAQGTATFRNITITLLAQRAFVNP